MVVEDRVEKEKARRKAEQEAEELKNSVRVSVLANLPPDQCVCSLSRTRDLVHSALYTVYSQSAVHWFNEVSHNYTLN